MFPSNRSRRAAILCSFAAGSCAFALTAAPAQAAGSLTVGAACPNPLVTPTSVLTALNLKCVSGTLTALVPALPTSVPTLPALPVPSLPAAPSAAPSSAAPNPLTSLAAGVTSTITGLSSPASAVTGPVSDAVNGAVSSLLNGVPSTAPTTATSGATGSPSGGTTGTSGTSTATGSNGGTAVAGSPLTGASKAPSTKDGSSLLGPAAAFLPGASLANFADLSTGGDLLPLADNIPSPLIASAEGKLAAVQAPLIAAGQAAATQADSSPFSRFGGKALPGILVVIGTALVAAVGAGNLRAWQTRFGGVVSLRAWKRSAK